MRDWMHGACRSAGGFAFSRQRSSDGALASPQQQFGLPGALRTRLCQATGPCDVMQEPVQHHQPAPDQAVPNPAVSNEMLPGQAAAEQVLHGRTVPDEAQATAELLQKIVAVEVDVTEQATGWQPTGKPRLPQAAAAAAAAVDPGMHTSAVRSGRNEATGCRSGAAGPSSATGGQLLALPPDMPMVPMAVAAPGCKARDPRRPQHDSVQAEDVEGKRYLPLVDGGAGEGEQVCDCKGQPPGSRPGSVAQQHVPASPSSPTDGQGDTSKGCLRHNVAPSPHLRSPHPHCHDGSCAPSANGPPVLHPVPSGTVRALAERMQAEAAGDLPAAREARRKLRQVGKHASHISCASTEHRSLGLPCIALPALDALD